MSELPDRIVIRGNAINTEHLGNGFAFNHDQVAELINHKAVNFVANHDLTIEAIAGTVEFTDAKRRRFAVERIQVEEAAKSKAKYERATMLGFKAELSSEFNAYEKVARNILALRKAGRVPNVSVFIYGTGIRYEEDTDRFFLEGPYTLRHLGQVDLGAFSDEVGVGVYDVEVPEGETAATLSYMDPVAVLTEGSPSKVATDCAMSICLANQGDLVEKFIEDNLGEHPDLVEKLGQRLGHSDSGDEAFSKNVDTITTVSVTEDGEPITILTLDGQGNVLSETHSTYTVPLVEDNVDTTVSKPIEGTGMSEETTPTTPAPEPVEAGKEPTEPVEATVALSDVQTIVDAATGDLREELAAMRAERVAAKDTALAETRNRIATKFGLEASSLEVYTDLAALEHFEATLSATRSNPIVLNKRPVNEAELAKKAAKKAEYDEWQKEMSKFGMIGGL